jgi:hypothetical protein
LYKGSVFRETRRKNFALRVAFLFLPEVLSMPAKLARASSPWSWLLFASLLSAPACVEPFDTTRKGEAGPLGEEVYGLVCDRVGAQSLRDDLGGTSYQSVCHRSADAPFTPRVDRAQLPPIGEGRDREGNVVPYETQLAVRERGIARVEALAGDRDPLIQAFTAMLPDVTLPVRETCSQPARLYDALRNALSDMVPLYQDETVPELTRALGELLSRVDQDPALATALARIAVREGYRPRDLALYVIRPLLAYPRLFDLGAALAAVHRDNKHGARDALAEVLHATAGELREAASEKPEVLLPLRFEQDEALGFTRINRPRSAREVSLSLLSEVARASATQLWIVRRDGRGLARVHKAGGVLPYPFMADPQGEPLVDELGRFVTQDGRAAPLPFAHTPDRQADGRARTADDQLLYDYLPIPGSVFSEVSSTFAPLFVPREDRGVEAMLDAMELLGPLLGGRAGQADAYQGQSSPLVSFVHALSVILTRPEMEDTLALLEKLTRERPEVVSRLVKLVLSLDAVADKYPNVKLRDSSTLWDELIDVGTQLAQKPGLVEALLRTFQDERTAQLGKVFAAYMVNRDEITYHRDAQSPSSFDSLNGKVFHSTTGDFSDMHTPVDRGLPDSGTNRSVLQRFLQLLHDANGLTACSKDGAIAHVDIRWLGVPVKLDYPTNPLAQAVCSSLGAPVSTHIPECGILRFDNVASLIVKVALNEYQVEIRDPCLAKLVDSPLTGLVGGAQAFLEETSGIRGFGVSPTVQGVARMAFFDAPYDDWGGFGGDFYYPKTRDFLKDVLAPVPSTVCPVVSTTDPADGSPIELRRCERFEDTLRGRDPNGLFPLEQLGFLDAVQPLARAFDDHEATDVFVNLMDVLHRHWGSAQQTREECDPSLDKSHARWCSQDGVSSYEPMLAEMLTDGDLFGELAAIAGLFEESRIMHCDERDAAGRCTRASERDGLTVLAEAVRALIDPSRTPGLVARDGATRATRNDGSEGSLLTPAHLWLDALGDLRRGFTPEAREVWLKARSHIIDRLLLVEEREGVARFRMTALDTALPLSLSLLRQQLAAHCPVPSATEACPWVATTVADLTDVVEAPLSARLVDVLDALRKDERSRVELGRLSSHLLGLDEEAHASTVAALMDFLQVLDDDESMQPIESLLADAMSSASGERGQALAPRTLELLARFFAAPEDSAACGGVDPHHAFAHVLTQAVTPNVVGERAPIEVLLDSALRVNRVDPRATSDLSPDDIRSIGRELSALMLDPASGLEQLYTVLRQATGGSTP